MLLRAVYLDSRWQLCDTINQYFKWIFDFKLALSLNGIKDS